MNGNRSDSQSWKPIKMQNNTVCQVSEHCLNSLILPPHDVGHIVLFKQEI